MPVGLESILWVLGILVACLGVLVVLVIIASKEEELDPNSAEAYAIDMLNDEEFDKVADVFDDILYEDIDYDAE